MHQSKYIMGWSGQGFIEEINSNKPNWIVDSGNGEYNKHIASFHKKSIDDDIIESTTRIFYGCSNMEYFRGISLIKSVDELKSLLKIFNGYPVYKTKWSGITSFDVNKLKFHRLENTIIFHDYKKWNKGEWSDLMWDLQENFNNYFPNSLKTDLRCYYNK